MKKISGATSAPTTPKAEDAEPSVTTPPFARGPAQPWYDTSLLPPEHLTPPDDPALASAPDISTSLPSTTPAKPTDDQTPSILLPRLPIPSPRPKTGAPTDNVSRAAFVLSLIGGVGIAHVLGYLGLKRTADEQRSGRKLATAALVIATAWLVAFTTIGVVTLMTFKGKTPATELASGYCIDGDTQGEVSRVKVVNCTTPHNAEVMGSFALDDESFPGNEALVDQAEQRCPDYVPEDADPQLAIYYLVPTTETWANGDRDVVCLVVSTGAPLTEPLS